MTKQAELTVTKHSVAKLRNRKTFEEGEQVVVYDNHKKLSYPAVVSEILGTNNYLVLSDNGPKHVSGDVMSRAAQPPPATTTTAPIETINPDITDNEDNVSITSEFSDDFNELIAPQMLGGADNVNNIVQRNRRGQREVANLGNAPQNLSRLRSGRI